MKVRFKKYFILTLLLVGFLGYGFSQNNDISLLRKINVNRNVKFDTFFEIVTHSDAPISLLTPTAIFCVGLIKKDSLTKTKGIAIGGSLVLSSVITIGLKYSIKRDRPFATHNDIQNVLFEKSPSFPSGHTSMAFSTATSISLMYPKWYVIAPAFIWASSIGYSRMHLGVHYPSDVLVGSMVGVGSAFLSRFLTNKILQKN